MALALYKVMAYPSHRETVLGYVNGTDYWEALERAQVRYGLDRVRDVYVTTLRDVSNWRRP